MGHCRSTGCKVISCQSWQFEKNSAAQPESNSGSPGSADWQNLFQRAAVTNQERLLIAWPQEM